MPGRSGGAAGAISIHVPLAGHDYSPRHSSTFSSISIHVPLAGHDSLPIIRINLIFLFQSTCPLRGTTTFPSASNGWISFQSTCPLRGTTISISPISIERCISIHVPLAGHDPWCPCFWSARDYFNPRAPCGARRMEGVRMSRSLKFQSTCPLRGTTIRPRTPKACENQFQSTCPLRGTTIDHAKRTVVFDNFNPRAPCGARPPGPTTHTPRAHFNPRAPCGARHA